MNNLTIKMINAHNLKPDILVNGHTIKFKQNKFGSYEINYQANESFAIINIYRTLELSSKFWFVFALLFYIISIFGIFDVLYSKNCITLNCKLKVQLEQNCNLTIRFNNCKSDEKSVTIECNNEVEEIYNYFYEDKKVTFRVRLLIVLKILSWFILATTLALIIFKK